MAQISAQVSWTPLILTFRFQTILRPTPIYWPPIKIATLLVFVCIATATHADPPSTAIPSCEFDARANIWRCTDAVDDRALALDWLPADYLSPQERSALGPGCSGSYRDPFAADDASSDQVKDLPLLIEADESEIREASFAKLEGQVRVSQGPRAISAETMSYDRERETAKLEGAVTIRQKGMLIRGESAQVSTNTQTGIFKEAKFVMHDKHMRGSAESIEQTSPGTVVLKNGAISSCEPDSKGWSLEGGELSVNADTAQGFGKNVMLKLGGLPVFYLPYISFPVGDERRSGFLFPSFNTSDDGGIDVAIPYYLNLAPNYDLTLTPRLITGRGAMIESEFRHLSPRFMTQVNAAFLGSDDGGNRPITDENGNIIERHIGSDRWLFSLQQTGGFDRAWYSQIDFNRSSDEDYFRDLGTSSFSVANTTFLNQFAELGHQSQNWNVSIKLQDYETLLFNLDEPYRKLPEIQANGIYALGAAMLNLKNTIIRFDHPNERDLDGNPIIDGTRAAVDYRISLPKRRPGYFVVPEAGYKSLYYLLDVAEGDELPDDSVSIDAAQFSLDSGLIFEHTDGNFLQTLEPRVFYLYREFVDHSQLYDATSESQSVNFDTGLRNFSYAQLYRDSKFSGSDRLDDAHQITLGITTRWMSSDDRHEFFSLSAGQIIHFEDRRIGLEREIINSENSSEIAVEFNMRWRNGSGLYGNFIYDEASDQLARANSGYNYASKDQLSLFNISYSYVNENPEVPDSEILEQVDAGFVFPVRKQWYLIGRSNYDLENRQELESIFGIEFNDCCYRVRVMTRRWLDDNVANLDAQTDPRFDQGLFFELHLKGLGGSGAKINSILEDAIPGYRRRESILNTQ
jgi:LPS-assembly protein